MGAVYLGVREYGAFRQWAAVKVVAADRPGVATRFEFERATLASLRHPHVPRLLDTGTPPDGVSYLAMDHVDRARPIDRHSAEAGLSVADRVRLVTRVCDVVGFVHRRGHVVHCDIKPANVLVDADGAPWLIDFGIARAAAAGRGPAVADPTGTGPGFVIQDYASLRRSWRGRNWSRGSRSNGRRSSGCGSGRGGAT